MYETFFLFRSLLDEQYGLGQLEKNFQILANFSYDCRVS